ncbi:MAG: hypothetical protein CME32_01180 [Gimesia sp.]|nr:hypothetical protein [Gimesia sp.]
MDRIYAATPLTKFKDHLNFSQLSQEILEKIPSDRQEYFHRIQLKHPSGDDLPGGKEPHQVLVTKVAHVRKGESVPPHGHSSMVSAFLCLSGEFDVQLFDRLDNREDEMVVRHSKRNKTAGPGTWSSISDYRDNVHWLTAKTEDCFLFTCKMLSVEPKLPLNGRIHINLKEAKSIGNNTYIAPKISYARAQELY